MMIYDWNSLEIADRISKLLSSILSWKAIATWNNEQIPALHAWTNADQLLSSLH